VAYGEGLQADVTTFERDAREDATPVRLAASGRPAGAVG
jgi:hypothetical protein